MGNVCDPCVGVKQDKPKPLPNNVGDKYLMDKLQNNAEMMNLLGEGQNYVDTAKGYLPQIKLYRKLFVLSKREAQLSQPLKDKEIAVFEKKISGIETQIDSIQEELQSIRRTLEEVDDPQWQMNQLGIKKEPSKKFNQLPGSLSRRDIKKDSNQNSQPTEEKLPQKLEPESQDQIMIERILKLFKSKINEMKLDLQGLENEFKECHQSWEKHIFKYEQKGLLAEEFKCWFQESGRLIDQALKDINGLWKTLMFQEEFLRIIKENSVVIFCAVSQQDKDYQNSRISMLKEQIYHLKTYYDLAFPELNSYKLQHEKFQSIIKEIDEKSQINLQESIEAIKEFVKTLRVANNKIQKESLAQALQEQHGKVIDLREIQSFWLHKLTKNKQILELIEANCIKLSGTKQDHQLLEDAKYFFIKANVFGIEQQFLEIQDSKAILNKDIKTFQLQVQNLAIIRQLDQNIEQAMQIYDNLHKNILALRLFGSNIDLNNINDLHSKADQLKHKIEDLVGHANQLTDSFYQVVEVQQAQISLQELNKLRVTLRDIEHDQISAVSKQLEIWKQDMNFSIEVAEHKVFDDQPQSLKMYHEACMNIFKIGIQVKEIESDINSIERVHKYFQIQRELLNSDEAHNQVKQNLNMTMEIALSTEEVLWKYRILIKSFQTQRLGFEFDEDLKSKYNELETISQELHGLMSKVNNHGVLDELKQIWTDKFQSTLQRYHQAFKDDTFVLFIDKSQRFQRENHDMSKESLTNINRSLININNSILLNQSQISKVRVNFNQEQDIPVKQLLPRLRASDPNDNFQTRSQKIHDSLFFFQHDQENVNQKKHLFKEENEQANEEIQEALSRFFSRTPQLRQLEIIKVSQNTFKIQEREFFIRIIQDERSQTKTLIINMHGGVLDLESITESIEEFTQIVSQRAMIE